MEGAPTYPDIHWTAFVHDEDRKATAAMRKVPGLDSVLKAISSGTAERFVHTLRSHHSVKIGPDQYPSLWRMVTRASEALDIEPPDTYLDARYSINASAFGMKRYTITLNSGLVDMLTPEEVQAVIAHEVGHIVCEHMLYKSTAYILTQLGAAAIGGLFGVSPALITKPIQFALLRWSRAAELSCDRAGLLVTGDASSIACAMGKLAGGSRRYGHEFNLPALIQQARDFEEDAGVVEKAFDLVHQMGLTHPEPVRRAREILRWANSEQYETIRSGTYALRSEVDADGGSPPIEGMTRCRACKSIVVEADRCPRCGVRTDPAFHVLCPTGTGHVNDASAKFCRKCGAAIQGG